MQWGVGMAGRGAGGLLLHFHSESKCSQALYKQTLTASAPRLANITWDSLNTLAAAVGRLGLCRRRRGGQLGIRAWTGWSCSQSSLVL